MLKEYIKKIQMENDQKIRSLEDEMQELIQDLTCEEKMLETLQRDKQIDTNIFSPRTIDFHADEKINKKKDEIQQIKQKIEYVSHMIEENKKLREEYQVLNKETEQAADLSVNVNITNDLSTKDEINTIRNTNIKEKDKASSFNNTESKNVNKTVNNTTNNIANSPIDKAVNKPADNTVNDIVNDIVNDTAKVSNYQSENISGIKNNPKTSDTSKTEDVMRKMNEDSKADPGKIENGKEQDESMTRSLSEEDREKLLAFLQSVYKKCETSLALLNGNKNRCRTEIKSNMNLIKQYAKKVENGEL